MTFLGNGEKTKTILGLAKESIVGLALITVIYMFLGHLRESQARLDRLSTAIERLAEKLDALDRRGR